MFNIFISVGMVPAHGMTDHLYGLIISSTYTCETLPSIGRIILDLGTISVGVMWRDNNSLSLSILLNIELKLTLRLSPFEYVFT